MTGVGQLIVLPVEVYPVQNVVLYAIRRKRQLTIF
jgi:hypothetical protein